MTFSAVLLAGGESRRMGRDKATLVVQGEPLWQRQLQILRELRPEKIYVSARSKPDWLPNDAESLLDTPPSRGPLSGLTNALQRMQTSHLIVLAVDMPFMPSKYLRYLCGFCMNNCGLVPVVHGWPEPLAAIYPREAEAAFANALAGDDFSLQTLAQELSGQGYVQMLDVQWETSDYFRSLNEPQDLAAAVDLGGPPKRSAA